jgi:radical SAM protein with 4Fe4S-binding SPASM domain
MKQKINPKKRRNAQEWIKQELGQDGIKAIVQGKHNLLHVEIHPHHESTEMCNNNCEGCTGGQYRHDSIKKKQKVGIKTPKLIQTINSFKNTGIKRVVYSGNCTEPLLYPNIEDTIEIIRKANLEFSLYSNFYNASDSIIKVLTSKESINDYLRISLDAGSKKSYNLAHSPKDQNAFNIILENIENLLEHKKQNNPNLFIDITYLLSNKNTDKQDLEFISKWAHNHEGINGLRFTTYQKPLARKMPSSLIITDLKQKRKLLAKLKQEYSDKENFQICTMDDEHLTKKKEKPFSKCYVQNVFAVIGFDGEVYPCTAMAYNNSPQEFRFGNINNQEFWEIVKNVKKNFPLTNCYDCTRNEYKMNEMFDKLSKS